MNTKHLIIVPILFLSGILNAQPPRQGEGQVPEPISAAGSTHVVSIEGATVTLLAGSTYSYTVDTPEGEGLVRTGLTVDELGTHLSMPDGEPVTYLIRDRYRGRKYGGYLADGDVMELEYRGERRNFPLRVEAGALTPELRIPRQQLTTGTPAGITLDFIAGQRSPDATVRFYIPRGIDVTLDNTTVNVIGRGEVTLRDLPRQSIGHTGTNYSYTRVGEVSVTANPNGGQIVTFTHLDLRPLNGIDVRLRIKEVNLPQEGEYVFTADYTTSQPEVYRSRITPRSTATVRAVNTVTDFRREMPVQFTLREDANLYLKPELRWTPPVGASSVTVMASADNGRTWEVLKKLRPGTGMYVPEHLQADRQYRFKLITEGGLYAGESNPAEHYTGRMNVKTFGVQGDGLTDDTDAINRAILAIYEMGGGVLSFTSGDYAVRTVQLKSNVWLHIDKEAIIRCLGNTDEPEATWFSDRAYRAGLSPTDPSPYADPENYLTKQDVGHTFFQNTMFFAERERNIKIFGNGRITGNGNLSTGDRIMDNPVGRRADKMFTFKLCTQIEIGGYDTGKDMWYDPDVDEPYYIEKGGRKDFAMENVLHIDQGGHFVLLATGSDTLNVHNTYFGKHKLGSARDIYDFMACNRVAATNIYSKMSSDDIVKLGSDCSLGFTRAVKDYLVRNIIGDTNCNLFQIGSETADDIEDVYVDNIYVLASNKAGFSISTNDGANIRNIYLNSGKTGKIHSRSMMFRTRAPFFISISNRGRVIGADVQRFRFKENGAVRDELLVTNSNIGSVENIFIHDIDIAEVYAGSSHNGIRWKPYDGSQNEATPIIAGYSLPDPANVEGGLNFKLPDGRHTGYITNIRFEGVNLLAKGGHPAEDATASPPEIGVGRYNVGDLRIQPAYGFWFRHAKDVVVRNCTIRTEQPDGRHAIVLDDVLGARIEKARLPETGTPPLIKTIHSENVVIR